MKAPTLLFNLGKILSVYVHHVSGVVYWQYEYFSGVFPASRGAPWCIGGEERSRQIVQPFSTSTCKCGFVSALGSGPLRRFGDPGKPIVFTDFMLPFPIVTRFVGARVRYFLSRPILVRRGRRIEGRV